MNALDADPTQRHRPPTVSIVIVNWNAGPLLRRCLESIPGALTPTFALGRVVIVDNASTDHSLEGVETLPLPIVVIRNATNRGFGAACNQGASRSDATYLLFLNPDVCLRSDSLSVPLSHLEDAADSRVGVAGIQLRDEQGQIARSSARVPTPGMVAARILGLDVLWPQWVPSLMLTDWDHASSREVPHVIGAFYLVRRSLFEHLGGFDERFFVYLEDLDFSVRAHEAGWTIEYLASTHATHTGGGTSDAVKALRIAYSLHSRIRYGYKHFGPITATTLALGTLVLEPLPRLARALARGSVPEMRDTCMGFAFLWRRVLSSLVGVARS